MRMIREQAFPSMPRTIRCVASPARVPATVSIMFAGDHVLLSDDVEGVFPRLSDRLIGAMQAGRTMILQFELLAPRLNRPASFDGNASVELETAGAREAIASMRYCASLPALGRRSGALAAGDRLK